MDDIKISVIMPAYNAENYIKKAIESILMQSYQNFELIIIDDCSTDSTMKIVNSFNDRRIYILNNECNKGIAYSRNKGLEHSRGVYIAIMDDDDIALQNRFESQVEFLDNHHEIEVVGGRVQFIDEYDNIIRVSNMVFTNPKYIRAHLLFANPYCNSEVMFRKSIYTDKKIKYEDGMYGMEDFRFWIDCSKVSNMCNIDELFLLHRVFHNNETQRIKRNKGEERAKKYSELLKHSIEKEGFKFSDKEFEILLKVMSENNRKCETQNELILFHNIIVKLLTQAENLQLYNYEEIKIFCKRQFGEIISKTTFIWGNNW